MTPRPTIAAYVPETRSALIELDSCPTCQPGSNNRKRLDVYGVPCPDCQGGRHLTDWMTVDDVYEQAFAWFDLARELRGRELAVEAVEAS